MKAKSIVQYEEVLHVKDYQGDFEACRNDVAKVRSNFVELLKKLFPDNIEAWDITSIDFQEFDSTNPCHAAAYFLCTLAVDTNALFWAYAEYVQNEGHIV